MKRHIFLICFAFISLSFNAFSQIQSWEGIHQTPFATVQSNFETPPVEFASHVIWGWSRINIDVIRRDLDTIYSRGFRSVIVDPGRNMPFEYLSDGWFKIVAEGVQEAKKRGMKVRLIDDGSYPSGFAGGKFIRERPDLRMQALVVCDTIPVAAGTTLGNRVVEPFVISAVAINDAGQPNRTVEIIDHKINFNAGQYNWQILLVRSDFRTGATRAVNDPTGAKTTANSLCDYLNPVAVRQYIDWTHEQYKKYLGNEMGVTVLGFRGDEPDFAYTPWTPAIVEIFKQKKGYDPTPYLASLLARPSGEFGFRTAATIPYPGAENAPLRTEQEKRFRADYWDVWSELFAVNFFKQQADWCDANGVAHITHLNNEHNMPVCIRNGGDFFRNLSKVQIPGVDVIWNQIWPGTVNDFPKLASSVAHVYGKPRAFSESLAAYEEPPSAFKSIPHAKYVIDYQIVRGINFFEFMAWGAGSNGWEYMRDPGMKNLNVHTNRATYLMSQGIPGARIAMYYPTSTMWLGNNTVYPHITSLTATLLQRQYDFDYVNDDAFIEGTLSVEQGYLKNSSGQKYYTLIIPSADVISTGAWEKIKEFAQRGGKVLFWGKKPDMLVGKSFMNPIPFPVDFVDCLAEPYDSWTQTVEAAMPAPEMRIQLPPRPRRPQANTEPQPAPPTDFIRYTRRILPDADLYFLFNEGEQPCTFTAEFDKAGKVKAWDSVTGNITDIPCKIVDGKVIVTFEMPAWDCRIISIQ